MAKFQYEKQCFSEITIPIRFYKRITIQKSQGVSIGLVKDWDNSFITLPSKHINACLGTDLVDFSRAIPKESFSI